MNLEAARDILARGVNAIAKLRQPGIKEISLQQIKENSGAIWISNTFPAGRLLDVLRLIYRALDKESRFYYRQHKNIEDSFDELQFPGIRQIIPCFKEGGVYVTFGSKEQAKQVLTELHNTVTIRGEKKKAFLVQGKPFIEDLSHSWPSFKLNVELVDIAKVTQRLSQEMIYNEMRTYGKMADIVVDPKKETATVRFSSQASAISARNCLHLKPIGDTKFYIRYEPWSRLHIVYDAIKNPRILIPLLGLLITVSTYLLVDPMRVASVTQHVTRGHREDTLNNALVMEKIDATGLREDSLSYLRKALRNHPDGLFVITGPSGAGKTMLINRILHKRAFTVKVDCKSSKNVIDFVENLGDSIGFSPSFNTLNTLLNWLESFIPGLKKTALSPSVISQLQSILHVLDNVLYLISASYPSQKEKEGDYAVVAFDGFHELLETLETSASKEERDKSKELMNTLFGWAVKNSNLAHIVFLGENPYGEELMLQHPIIKKAKIRALSLKDLNQDEMTSYLNHHLERRVSEQELEFALSKVGGRVSDLLNLVARINSGSDVRAAVNAMIEETEMKLRTEGLGGSLAATTKKWNQVQFWKCLKQIVQKGSVPYDDLLFKVFSGNNDALKSLVEEDLLAIQKEHGQRKVTFFSTLHRSASEKMMESSKFRLALDIHEKKSDLKKDLEEVVSIEEEYIKLQKAETGRAPIPSFVKRRDLLEEKLSELNPKVHQKELELKEMEAKLKS
eukprot:TRINITY_DN3490_c0_g1_i1.p1 TRINITY_DN3490_c0_g1~~TRINITY_DN3490_c0_g1_i1.p1  ORF type:complete len:735 (-),score=201.06 TRINITY_DN3490_c0_g1_i1:16-2220(-)